MFHSKQINDKMPYHGINAHLEPFLPYIEKAESSPVPQEWHLPDNLSRPISVEKVKSWLKNCDRFHADHCREYQLAPPDQRPLWLVDVHRKCIVPAKAGVGGLVYATLSYVWGNATCFSLTTDTLDTLLAEGSLNNAGLPATIRDAMTLAASLDLAYLWVDRLCIVQDSAEEKQAQIKAMASIYSHAYFTIIAAQSHDASGPLTSRPLKDTPPPQRSPGLLATFSKSLVSWRRTRTYKAKRTKAPENATRFSGSPQTDREVMNIMAADLLRTIWFSRGWTFQEFLFSRRKIVFHNNTVNWECHCTSSHEGQVSFANKQCMRPSVHVTSLGVEIDPWPNFHRYARLAALITPRNFTFPEDVLDAFAGASNAFARIYDGGLVTGLPEMLFDAALIWQPYHPLTRRKAVLAPEGDAVLPSWSWFSWRGNVQSESWQSGYDYLRLPVISEKGETVHPRWSTYQTVDWYHSATLTSTRYCIKSQAFEWRDRYLDKLGTDLPPGWQRHTGANGPVFVHQNVPDQEFWFPIPIGIGDGQASRSRFLHCNTRQAKVDAYPEPYLAFASGCAVVALKGPEGGFAGCLRLNSYKQSTQAFAEPFHLIELSAGRVSLEHGNGGDLLDHPLADVFDEWSLPPWNSDKHSGLYEFYNVMHVEWVSPNVVSRLAVGRVEKSVWERLAVETVEVAIG